MVKEMHLQENTLYDLDLSSGQGHTKRCPVPSKLYDLRPAKFEVATSNSLGDAFTRKYII